MNAPKSIRAQSNMTSTIGAMQANMRGEGPSEKLIGPATASNGQIAERLRYLEESVSSLNESLAKLHEAIRPAVGPLNDFTVPSLAPLCSEFGNFIISLDERIRAANAYVRALTDAVEL